MTVVPNDHCTLRVETGVAFASTSKPEFVTTPRLRNSVPGNPVDGALGTATSASVVRLRKYVNTTPPRPASRSASKPSSSSRARSGRIVRLPGFCGMIAAWPPVPAIGE